MTLVPQCFWRVFEAKVSFQSAALPTELPGHIESHDKIVKKRNYSKNSPFYLLQGSYWLIQGSIAPSLATPSSEGFIPYNFEMKSYNILFLCTGNSARSILAEALATTLSGGKFIGYSAGSNPAGRVNPFASELAIEIGYSKEKLRSKNWNEYSLPDSPRMDFIITVCDSAANEACPIWLGHPLTAHWGFPDPASVEGIDAIKREAFQKTLLGLTKNIEALVQLPIDQLDLLSLKKAIQDIHDE